MKSDTINIPTVANEKLWKSLNESDLQRYVQKIFETYRISGFPYYRFSHDELIQEYQKLLDYDYLKILNGTTIKQTMHGLGLAWSYFPHSWGIRCNNYPTPMEIFNNDELFMNTIKKRLKYGTYMSDSGMRKALRTYNHVQSVSNFRPSAAAAIYQYAANLLGKKSIDTWDMSSGFGGRLLGAFASKVVKNYYGTDPSFLTWNGLVNMSRDILGYTSTHIRPQIWNIGSETELPFGKVDVAFSSPPYFDTEKYATDEKQSYVAFPTYSLWLNQFLGRTIDNVISRLNPDGLFIINVANVKNAPNLTSDTCSIALNKGFRYITTLDLSLSNRTNGYKFEPVFVFALDK